MTKNNKILGTVGLIGRFKPLHNGAVLMLEAVCDQAEQVKIGIGSCNKYNLRNPFTADETEAMLRAYLAPRYDNFEIIHVPDFAQIPEYADGQQWRKYVRENFGTLGGFVSGNDYVRNLLKDDYGMIHLAEIIPKKEFIVMRATEVRLEMARGTERWEELVPREVAAYLNENNLVDRFRREFGIQTLAQLDEKDNISKTETAEEEQRHTREE